MKLLESKVVFMAHDFWLKDSYGLPETLLTAFLGHLLLFRFTLPESVRAHAIWMCMAKAPLPLTYESLQLSLRVRPKTFPLVSWQNTVSISLLVTRYIITVCVWEDHTMARWPEMWSVHPTYGAIKLASSFHSIAQCKKKTLVVHTVSLHHRVLYHQTNTTHPSVVSTFVLLRAVISTTALSLHCNAVVKRSSAAVRLGWDGKTDGQVNAALYWIFNEQGQIEIIEMIIPIVCKFVFCMILQWSNSEGFFWSEVLSG